MVYKDSDELKKILERFAGSGWDLIEAPAKLYLEGSGDRRNWSLPSGKQTRSAEAAGASTTLCIKERSSFYKASAAKCCSGRKNHMKKLAGRRVFKGRE